MVGAFGSKVSLAAAAAFMSPCPEPSGTRGKRLIDGGRMTERNSDHAHNWVIVSHVDQQECERWLCVGCGQKRVRVVADAPLIDVAHWPSE